MPGPVIAQKIGLRCSMSPLTKKPAALRPEYAGIDPADRMVSVPGRIAGRSVATPSTRDDRPVR